MFKKILVFMALTLLLSILSLGVYGEIREKELDIKEAFSQGGFEIRWENSAKKAVITITDPQGVVFNEVKTPEAFSVLEDRTMVYVGEATVGVWKISVEGDQLGKVTVDVGELPNYADIQLFEVSKTGQNTFTATWNTENVSQEISYTILMDIDGVGKDGAEVASFLGAGQGSYDFSVQGKDTGDYYFILKAKDHLGVSDYQYTKNKVLYENPQAPQYVQNVKANRVNEEIYITWEELAEAEAYDVKVYPADGQEALFHDTTTELYATFMIPQGQDLFDIAVSGVRYGVSGQYQRLRLSTALNIDATVELPKSGSLSTHTLQVPVHFEKGYTMDAFINDTFYIENATEAGTFKLQMEEGINAVGFVITDSMGNKKSYEAVYTVDTYPPQLSVFEDLHKKQIKENTVVLSGKTEPGATLFLNQQEQEISSLGVFSFNIGLGYGKNTILLTARDVAGNESVYSATVMRDFFGSDLMWMIFTVIAILLIVWSYYFTILFRRKRK